MMMDIKKLSLDERLTDFASTQSNAEKASEISKQPLSEKLRQIKDGDIFGTDTFPYIRDLKCSANISLYQMVTEQHKIDEVNSKLHESGSKTTLKPINTYGELAWMASETKRITMAKTHCITPVDDIKDDEFEIFLLLCEVFLGEYKRRRAGFSKSDYPGMVDISSLFPAFNLPLPLYFKASASAECCKDEDWKNYLLTLYKEVYAPFVRRDEATKEIVHNCMQSQPVKDTGYCDPVTMFAALRIADEDKIISTNEWLDKIFDIVITPFMFCEPSSM